MLPLINSKQPNAATTIFTVMSVLAAEHNAINLGQGYPDFMMDEELIALVNAAMQKGNNQYVHMNGLVTLRERLAEKIDSLYNATIDPQTEITITPGGTYAIYTALTTILQPGDEAIVFEPAYDSYIPNIIVNGATPVLVSLQYPTYAIDWEEVKKKITGFRSRNPEAKNKRIGNRKKLLVSESMIKGQEEERKRLAKDLHDGLGGILSSAKYSFGNMKNNFIFR